MNTLIPMFGVFSSLVLKGSTQVSKHPSILPGDDCIFPESWHGNWFLQGEETLVNISRQDFGIKGFCYSKACGDCETSDTGWNGKPPKSHGSANDGKHYVIHNRQEDCFRCLVFYDRHNNVLQLHEGICRPYVEMAVYNLTSKEASLRDSEIIRFCNDSFQNVPSRNGIEPLKSMVRIQNRTNNAERIECPFYGDYIFSYKGCQLKHSRVDRCMSKEQVAFKFHECPDGEEEDSRDLMIGTMMENNLEDGVESLTCIGNWTSNDGQRRYLIGSLDVPFVTRLEDKIRCFLYKDTNSGGWKLSQSSSPSCDHLRSFQSGYRNFHLKKEKEFEKRRNRKSDVKNMNRRSYKGVDDYGSVINVGDGYYNDAYEDEEIVLGDDNEPIKCKFPPWSMSGAIDAEDTSEDGTWESFSLTSQYFFTPDGGRLIVSNFSHFFQVSQKQVSQQVSLTRCEVIVDNQEDESIKMVVKVIAGCDTKFKCMSIFRRTEDVLEIQEGPSTSIRGKAACDLMVDDKLPFTTLLRPNPPARPCTANGYHNVTSLKLKGSTEFCDESSTRFNEVSLRCEAPESLQFLQHCDTEGKSEFLCLGGWEQEIPYNMLPGVTSEDDDMNSYSSSFYESATGNRRITEYGSSNYYSEQDEEEDMFSAMYSDNVTLGYLLARPNSKMPKGTPQRICIIYIRNANDTLYSWTVERRSCVRNIHPGVAGVYKFNTTKLESCGAFSMLLKTTSIMLYLPFMLAFLWLSSFIHTQRLNVNGFL